MDNDNMVTGEYDGSGSSGAPMRAEVLRKAEQLTVGSRNMSYGDPTQNHDNIAGLWNAYINIRTPNGLLFEPDAEDVMIMMALVKIARMTQRLGGNFDSRVDACAYIAMTQEASGE